MSGEPLELRAAVELLRRAEAERQAGRLESALDLADELERRAPALLVEERHVLTILVECGRGEVARARALMRELDGLEPASIYGGRLRSSCVGASVATPKK